jgi:hypothetical protein
MNPTEINAQLTAPFPALEIEWRMGQTGTKKSNGQPWGKCFAYITNRAIMSRLDEVAGPAAWRNEYRFETIKSSAGDKPLCLCGLSLLIEGQWVTKWDGAEPTDIETGKGALSDSMKRAAVQWGIGRYLYRLEEGWAEFTPEGANNVKIDGTWHRWNPPQLPAWALPERKAVESRPAPEPPKVTARTTAAISTAQASHPARQVAPLKIGTQIPAADQAADDSWRAFPVPRLIKKYVGKTLGDMEADDIFWWANNYEPRPFNGAIAPADIELQKMLKRAAAQLLKPSAAPDAEYDVRY